VVTGTAGTEQTVGTRLNQLPAERGGGAPTGGRKDLASSPAQKKAAARAIEEHIEPDTAKAGRGHRHSAVKAFRAEAGDGWATSTALKKAHEAWGGQVENPKDRLDAEKGALRSANTVLRGTDLAMGAEAGRTSPLDRY